ncbi:MAG: hypothetical protein KAT68_18170 [Bacteroidales bacterium]|nr:hypothetical protein [Bacteroidales bacterium]
MLSCTNETTTELEIGVNLQPLKVGNYWVYHFNTVDDTLRYTVVEEVDIEVDGEIKTVNRIAMANLNYYEFNDDQGYHYIQRYESVTGEDSLANYSVFQYKYPVEINDTWFQDFDNDGFTIGDNTVQCISVNTTIECPVGSFDCIAYKVSCPETTESYYIEYFCIGIGRIKSISFHHENNSFDEKTLVEYHVQE